MDHPVSWWMAQAARIPPGLCPKCQAVIPGGEYVVDVSGDSRFKKVFRAVMERCRTCGWLHVHMTQEQSGSVEMNKQGRLFRPVGVELTDDEVDRVGKRATVVRLPGAPLKTSRESERERYHKRKKKLLTNKGGV